MHEDCSAHFEMSSEDAQQKLKHAPYSAISYSLWPINSNSMFHRSPALAPVAQIDILMFVRLHHHPFPIWRLYLIRTYSICCSGPKWRTLVFCYAEAFSNFLVVIYQTFLRFSVLPREWQYARVVPMLKKGGPTFSFELPPHFHPILKM